MLLSEPRRSTLAGADSQPTPDAGPRVRRVQPEPPGGLGLALSAEPLSTSRAALGPRLDVGFGAGAFAGFASESFVATVGPGSDALLIDTQLGLAWGAPFAQHPFGVALSGGLEWLSAAGGTDSSAVFSSARPSI